MNDRRIAQTTRPRRSGLASAARSGALSLTGLPGVTHDLPDAPHAAPATRIMAKVMIDLRHRPWRLARRKHVLYVGVADDVAGADDHAPLWRAFPNRRLTCVKDRDRADRTRRPRFNGVGT